MKRRIISVAMVLIMIFSVSAFALEDNGGPWIPLIAVQEGEVGSVEIWNDCETLYVHYVLYEECGWMLESTHVHVQRADLCHPMKKSHNYTVKHCDATEYLYEIPLSDGCWGPDTDLMIAAHAVLVKEICDTVVDEGQAFYYSTDDGSTTVVGECEDTDAVLAYEPGTECCPTYFPDYWDSLLVMDETPFAFDSAAEWIWESEYVQNPVEGDVVTFQTEFEMPGVEFEGALQAACDNGMAVYLNGVLLGSSNLPEYPNLGDLTDAYVAQGWQEVQEFDLSGAMQQGNNVLKIIGVNEQMDEGTICSNPAGLKFQFETSWESIEECCCIRRAAWAYDERCPKGSWATYHPYTVLPCCPIDEIDDGEATDEETTDEATVEELSEEATIEEPADEAVAEPMQARKFKGNE